MKFRLRPARDSDMMMLFCWRNDPRVRAVMPFSGELQREFHEQWWGAAMRDPERRTMILEDRDTTPVAVVVFLQLRSNSEGVSAKWGFYTAPRSEIGKARSLRAWVACHVAALAYAFDILRLETLYCETLRTHTVVLRLTEQVGFESIGQVYLGEEKPPFVIQRLTRAAFHLGKEQRPLLARPKDVEIEPDPRDVAPRCRV